MRQVNIHEAKTHLSKLIADGKEVVIVRYGEPLARRVPIRPPAAKRLSGSAFLPVFAGQVSFLTLYFLRMKNGGEYG